jgi:hypothetical protein
MPWCVAGEIAALCPDLSALFLCPDSHVSESGLAALRRRCPRARWGVLGRQLSRTQLLGLLHGCGQNKLLCLDKGSVNTHLTDEGLMELAALLSADVEGVFTIPSSKITQRVRACVRACHYRFDKQVGLIRPTWPLFLCA